MTLEAILISESMSVETLKVVFEKEKTATTTIRHYFQSWRIAYDVDVFVDGGILLFAVALHSLYPSGCSEK